MQKNTYPGPLYLPYYIYSHQQYGILNDPLQKFFQEPYASLIPELFNGSYTSEQVNYQLTDTIPKLLTANLIENFNTSDDYYELRSDLVSNSIDAWQESSLLRFYHGNADDNVPVEQSETIYNNFISMGIDPAAIEYIEMDSLNHETALLPWGISTISWFNQLKSVY
jgi:hypothetical protein